MGGQQKYLCRKVQDGEIDSEDLLVSQEKLTLLRQAPDIFKNAVAKGWMSYPAQIESDSDDDVSSWLGRYDCERAYEYRQDGLTYREIGKLMGCGIARVVHILNRGEEIVLQRKIDKIGIEPIDLPDQETISKHTTSKRPTTKAKSK
jgi:hypothetical protein